MLCQQSVKRDRDAEYITLTHTLASQMLNFVSEDAQFTPETQCQNRHWKAHSPTDS